MKIIEGCLLASLIFFFCAFILTAEDISKEETVVKTDSITNIINEVVIDTFIDIDTFHFQKDTLIEIPIEIKTDTLTPDSLHYFPSEHHVDLKMLDSLSPYPLWAYITVLLESGYPGGKSPIAKKVNNNFGMKAPYSRCHTLTIKDLKSHPGLKINRKNKCGDTTISYNSWAAYLTPLESAKCFTDYQKMFVVKRSPNSPEEYIYILKELGYFTDGDIKKGYISKWLEIYKVISSKLKRTT